MKTKLFILSLTALVFSTICNAQEHDLLGKQILPQIDTVETGVVVNDSIYYLVDPIPDSVYTMVSPNPLYVIDSNIVIEPVLCGTQFPFEPDTMLVNYFLDKFYWSKDKFNAPYYYLQVATDSSFQNIIYSEDSLVNNYTNIKWELINRPQIHVFYDSVNGKNDTRLFASDKFYWRAGENTQGWGIYDPKSITWSKVNIGVCPTICKVATGLVFPNPAIDVFNVTALQGDLIEILDANGSVLVTTYGSDVSLNVINISQLKSGNYFLKVTSGGDVKTSRIIKQ